MKPRVTVTNPHPLRSWKLGEVTRRHQGAVAEVFEGDNLVVHVYGKDEAHARSMASVIAISPEMHRALVGAAVCLERFLTPPEHIATRRKAKPEATK